MIYSCSKPYFKYNLSIVWRFNSIGMVDNRSGYTRLVQVYNTNREIFTTCNINTNIIRVKLPSCTREVLLKIPFITGDGIINLTLYLYTYIFFHSDLYDCHQGR